MSYRRLSEQSLKIYNSRLLRVAVFPVVFLLVLGVLVVNTFIFNPVNNGQVEQKKCTDSIEVDSGRYGGTSSRCVSYDKSYVSLEGVIGYHMMNAAIVAIACGFIWIWYSRAILRHYKSEEAFRREMGIGNRSLTYGEMMALQAYRKLWMDDN